MMERVQGPRVKTNIEIHKHTSRKTTKKHKSIIKNTNITILKHTSRKTTNHEII